METESILAKTFNEILAAFVIVGVSLFSAKALLSIGKKFVKAAHLHSSTFFENRKVELSIMFSSLTAVALLATPGSVSAGAMVLKAKPQATNGEQSYANWHAAIINILLLTNLAGGALVYLYRKKQQDKITQEHYKQRFNDLLKAFSLFAKQLKKDPEAYPKLKARIIQLYQNTYKLREDFSAENYINIVSELMQFQREIETSYPGSYKYPYTPSYFNCTPSNITNKLVAATLMFIYPLVNLKAALGTDSNHYLNAASAYIAQLAPTFLSGNRLSTNLLNLIKQFCAPLNARNRQLLPKGKIAALITRNIGLVILLAIPTYSTALIRIAILKAFLLTSNPNFSFFQQLITGANAAAKTLYTYVEALEKLLSWLNDFCNAPKLAAVAKQTIDPPTTTLMLAMVKDLKQTTEQVRKDFDRWLNRETIDELSKHITTSRKKEAASPTTFQVITAPPTSPPRPPSTTRDLTTPGGQRRQYEPFSSPGSESNNNGEAKLNAFSSRKLRSNGRDEPSKEAAQALAYQEDSPSTGSKAKEVQLTPKRPFAHSWPTTEFDQASLPAGAGAGSATSTDSDDQSPNPLEQELKDFAKQMQNNTTLGRRATRRSNWCCSNRGSLWNRCCSWFGGKTQGLAAKDSMRYPAATNKPVV
jgi:hypothetical protein